MKVNEFIDKWKRISLNERASAQEHFIDLCRLMEHPTPAEDDPLGEHFTFEKGVVKTAGTQGYADVWKKGFFAFEYKKKKRDLGLALEQLTRYAAALENPPLHIVCDTVRFIIETRWTNTVVKRHEFELEDLSDPEKFKILHTAFHNPEKLRPTITRADITRDAANKFQVISDRLQQRYPDREAVAHFVNQLVFCFFANSVKLLPDGLWLKLLKHIEQRPNNANAAFNRMFQAMEKGGYIDFDAIKIFNGGLFSGSDALTLDQDDINLLISANKLDWSLIDPTIFGTLFERFLDPDKRAQIGAHYTDPTKIMLVIDPVIKRPLEAQWLKVRAQIEAVMMPVTQPTTFEQRQSKSIGKEFTAACRKAEIIRDDFLARLAKLRILDPACGSGNFLYLALHVVKDIAHKAILECVGFGLTHTVNPVGPEILHGIEINPFAAELARTTIWIGDIQWELNNAAFNRPEPILRNLNAIECRDALLTKQGDKYVAADWPEVDYIIGNPPFLGGKKLLAGLGDEYVTNLRSAYAARLPDFSDFVCFWFEKGREMVASGFAKNAGFVSTNSISGGSNRVVLDAIVDELQIFEAWSNEPWVLDGASVRVAVICFAQENNMNHLNGEPVLTINSDLTSTKSNLTKALQLLENSHRAFIGIQPSGAFQVSDKIARAWLKEPLNPNGKPNSNVLAPFPNAMDLVRRSEQRWLVDFGIHMSKSEANLYQSPFEFLKEHVYPVRQQNKLARAREEWWLTWCPRPEFRSAKQNLTRYIATPRVAKHRVFVWLEKSVLPDCQVVAIARDDDTTFGILHSRFHEAWSLRLCTYLGVGNDPRYTPTTTFSTFPFPPSLTPNIPAKTYAKNPHAMRIAKAAKRLDELRRNWLNPPDLVDIVPEVVSGFPDRIIPKNAEAAVMLKSRTLTNLYNQRPQWLSDAHFALDQTVASAYGWAEDITTDNALTNLLALNLERAAHEKIR